MFSEEEIFCKPVSTVKRKSDLWDFTKREALFIRDQEEEFLPDDVSIMIALNKNMSQRLVVAGNQSSVVFGASGVLKIYDATSGALHFSDSYRADNQDTYFRWVEKAGTDSFYVAGTVTDPTWVTTSRFRIVPITDHIFSDGMESP